MIALRRNRTVVAPIAKRIGRQVDVVDQVHRCRPSSTSRSIGRRSPPRRPPRRGSAARAVSTRETDGLGRRAVRQQGRGVDGVVPGVDARRRQAGLVGPALEEASLRTPTRWVTLSASRSRWASTIAPMRGGDQQGAGDLEGPDVLAEHQVARPVTLPAWLALVSPTGAPDGEVADRADQQDDQARGRAAARPTLALDRLDQGVGGVDADQHEDEQEEHHHRAGVDEHLHGAEELGALDDVEDARGSPSPAPPRWRRGRPSWRRAGPAPRPPRSCRGSRRRSPPRRRPRPRRCCAAPAPALAAHDRRLAHPPSACRPPARLAWCSSTHCCCAGVAASTLPW